MRKRPNTLGTSKSAKKSRETQGERTIKKRKQPSEKNNYLGRGFKWQSKPAMVEITPETKPNWLDWIRFKNSWLND